MPGTKTFTNAVLTAADMNAYGRGGLVMAHASKTANENFTVLADVTGLSVTFTAIAGRLYRVEAIAQFTSTVANDACSLYLTDGANNTLQTSNAVGLPTANSLQAYCLLLASPGAGSVTYKARVQRTTGTGTVTLVAAATYPAYISVVDIGVA